MNRATLHRKQVSPVEPLERRTLFAAAGDVVASATDPATGSTYLLLAPIGWDDAEAKAVQLGGHLAVISSQAEQDYVWSTFGPAAGIFWIGINDTVRDGEFVWTTGEPVGYTNWYAGEPNNLYPTGERWGNMWEKYGGQWNDLGPDSPEGATQFALAEVRDGVDLFATLNDVSPSLQPGESFDVNGTIRNLGNATVAGSPEVTYYVSADGVLDSSDRAIGTSTIPNLNLAFNASTAFAANLTLPSDLSPGTYRVLARIDSGSAIAEADETNNVAVTEAFDVGAVFEPVIRNVTGVVRDADDLPLHGVSVAAGDQTAFTDYDGAKSTLDRDGITGDFDLANVVIGNNVSIGGVFKRFVPLETSGSTLAVNAADLNGHTYSRQIVVGDLLTLDPTVADGGLPPRQTATLRPIFLADYRTVAPDKTVHLQRDLRNDKNSDRISLKPNRAIVFSAKYRKGVEAIGARLSTMGFREADGTPLVATPDLKKNGATDRALKLFRSIDFADAFPGSKPPKATSSVDEAALADLNGVDLSAGAFWTNTLPTGWSAAPDLADAYVNRNTFQLLQRLSSLLPEASLVLTHASPALGGSKTFRTGDEFEFRWITSAGIASTGGSFWQPIGDFSRSDVTLLGGRKLAIPDPAQQGVRWDYVPAYDRAANLAAVRSLLEAGVSRVTLNDPSILQDLGAISIVDGSKRTVTILRSDVGATAGGDETVHVSR